MDEIYEKASVPLFRALREDRRVERKTAAVHADVLGEYFSMWANTAPDGGIIVIGVEDGQECLVSGCAALSVQQLNKLESTRIDY